MRIFVGMAFDPKRLRVVREKYGSREKLSYALKEKPSITTLRNWEAGEANPGVDDLKRVCDEIGTTVAYVMCEIDDPSPTALDPVKQYESEVAEIKGRRFFADIDYDEAKAMGMTSDQIREEIAKMHRRLERMALEEAAEKLQKELFRRGQK